MIGDEEIRGKIRSMTIGDRVDSDHQPLEIWVEGEVRRKKRNGKQKESEKVIWDKEGCELFREKLRWEKKEDRSMEEEWGENRKEDEKRVEGSGRGTEEKKKEVRCELKKWRKIGGGKEKFREKKQEYKKLCEQKKKEETERWEKEAEQVRKESEIWEIVNRDRKKRKGINEEIEEEE